MSLTGQYKSSILYAAYGEEELNWARDMLTSIGASSLIGRKYRELSQGEKQTVLIARSLMDQPDLIIFDEASVDWISLPEKTPPSDPSYQTTGSRAYHDLRHPPCREITTDMTHVLLLKHGQVVEQGPKEKILTPHVLSHFYEAPVSLINLGDERLFVKPEIAH